MGFRVIWGLGFRVSGLVSGLGLKFRTWGFRFGVSGLGFGVQGFRFRVWV